MFRRYQLRILNYFFFLLDSKSVKELEADLKRIVLGEKKQQQQQERSAFDKLVSFL